MQQHPYACQVDGLHCYRAMPWASNNASNGWDRETCMELQHQLCHHR